MVECVRNHWATDEFYKSIKGNIMSIEKLLEISKQFEIAKVKDDIKLKKDFVAFSGTPQKHPYDRNKVILLTEPYSRSSYYEFKTKDIAYVEELSSIINMNEETVTMVRIWVKKKCIGVHCTPFSVEDIRMKF